MSMQIMDFISTKPVTRKKLVELTGKGDRAVRESITKERLKGKVIINMQDGKGYFLPDNMDVLEKWYEGERGRALILLAQLKFARRLLKENGRAVK